MASRLREAMSGRFLRRLRGRGCSNRVLHGNLVQHHAAWYRVGQRVRAGGLRARELQLPSRFDRRKLRRNGDRDCSNEPLPSTCNGAGYVTYTLEHQGPYFVRNHLGEDFEAKLFPGRIEHARGLGTERYLTNPLSS